MRVTSEDEGELPWCGRTNDLAADGDLQDSGAEPVVEPERVDRRASRWVAELAQRSAELLLDRESQFTGIVAGHPAAPAGVSAAERATRVTGLGSSCFSCRA